MTAAKQHSNADQRRRNEVEGSFGAGKRKYYWDQIHGQTQSMVRDHISMGLHRDVLREGA